MNGIMYVSARTLLAFFLIMIIAKILGKMTISQMTFHDFFTAITLGSLTANLAFNSSLNMWNTIASLLLFSGIAYLMTMLSLKSRKSRQWLSGKPTVLIEDGKILENNLRKQRLTLDTLVQDLREKDVFDLQEVQYAVLELNGKLSVMKKPEYQQIQLKDLLALTGRSKTQTQVSFPVELVMDGQLVLDNLKHNGISETWVHQELQKRKLTLSKTCYAVKGTDGSLYVDAYTDRIRNPIDNER